MAKLVNQISSLLVCESYANVPQVVEDRGEPDSEHDPDEPLGLQLHSNL
jgi:hypothetical protein